MDHDLAPPADSAMLREMHEHLAQIHRDARGSVRRELEALFLLAVEREKLAVVGYGGEGIAARVARLGADDAARAVIAHALRWASRDERTHAVLARGLLVATGSLATRARTVAADAGGLVAGWAAAVLQHTSLRAAPFSRLAARAVALAGRVAGKVPRSAASELRAQSFASFCRFQVGAEQTAIVSWERIASLLEASDRDRELAPVAARIAADERKHERILRALVEALDEHDRLRPGHDADTLAAAFAAVDPAFVRAAARDGAQDLPGAGGTVFVRHDPAAARAEPDALRALLRATLRDTGLLGELFARAPARPRVAVKTTFMMAYDRRDPSPHVDLVLAEELARLLREHGASDVAYLEAPNHYDRFFARRSVAEVARYAGFESALYRVVDASEEQVAHAYRRGLGQESVARTWRDADVRVVFGKMRTNPAWLVHLAVHTLESLGRRVDELLFMDRRADLTSALMMVLDAFPPHLAVLDATHHVPDGLTGILGDPDPAHPGRLYAARDPLALDLVAARHMGVTRLPAGSALALARDWFDDPLPRTRVDGPDAPLEDFLGPHRNDLTVLLAALAYPVYVLGGDRGNLWVPAMDPAAFPPRAPATWLEAIARPVLRRAFGFGRPSARATLPASTP